MGVETELIRVKVTTKNKVAKYVAGTKNSIGDFYDNAANEKLKRIRTSKKDKEVKLWDFLIKTLEEKNDNNYTARIIYDKVESLSPILF